jgi:hypothetical protein
LRNTEMSRTVLSCLILTLRSHVDSVSSRWLLLNKPMLPRKDCKVK